VSDAIRARHSGHQDDWVAIARRWLESGLDMGAEAGSLKTEGSKGTGQLGAGFGVGTVETGEHDGFGCGRREQRFTEVAAR